MKNLKTLAFALVLLVACAGENAMDGIKAEISDAELTGNRGQVLSSIQVTGYTYIEVRTDGRTLWLAGDQVEVVEGEVITWDQSTVMRNFQSKTLNRTFDEVIFVSAVHRSTDGAPPVT